MSRSGDTCLANTNMKSNTYMYVLPSRPGDTCLTHTFINVWTKYGKSLGCMVMGKQI